MYKSFYNISENPFSESIELSYTFKSKTFILASQQINKIVNNGLGFALLTSDPGLGKTIFCQSYINKYQHNICAGLVSCEGLDRTDLLRAICDTYCIANDITRPGFHQLRKQIIDFILSTANTNKSLVLFVDEAQKISQESLELLRMFSNVECESKKLIHIILCGQPKLIEKIDTPELRQLKQRLSLNIQLSPLLDSEVEAYIRHRIEVAGGTNYLRFDSSAIKLIKKISQNNPRIINSICHKSILNGFENKQRLLNHNNIKQIRQKPRLNASGFFKFLSQHISNRHSNNKYNGKGL